MTAVPVIFDEHHTAPTASGAVAMASSAGGLQALMVVLAALPKGFSAAVVIVQHIDPRHPSMMADLLGKRTQMTVRQAQQGDRLEAGVVYIAAPDRHLVVNADRTISLTETERVQYVRPSADVLFESVAGCFGKHAVAVVLSGTGRDGSDGIGAIHRGGGHVIVQDAASSEFGGMPDAARRTGAVDEILPISDIGPALLRWAAEVIN